MSRDNLAEIMVRRKFKDIELPESFWNLPSYKREYQMQLRAAQKLINIYDIDKIYKVVQDNKWIYSLNVKKIPELIAIEQEEKDSIDFIPTVNKTIKFRK